MTDTQDPKVVDTHSIRKTLEPGTYAWCKCGYSEDGLFCNGAHRGKGMVPTVFEVTETQELKLCLCKHTKTPPYCDGSHKPLREIVKSD